MKVHQTNSWLVRAHLLAYSRLKTLNFESLELRRLRADLILVYKIVFGLLGVMNKAFFLFPDPNHNCADIRIAYTK